MVKEAFKALKPSDLILVFGYGVYEAISKELEENRVLIESNVYCEC